MLWREKKFSKNDDLCSDRNLMIWLNQELGSLILYCGSESLLRKDGLFPRMEM